MTRLGLQLIPQLPVVELIETVQAAEELGYDYCLVADEGFMHDVYVVLGALAGATSRITLGPVTNCYTRHPAVTAAAMATLQEATGGRALLELVAGGTMVLGPMGLTRTAPLGTVADTISICRQLWSGERVSWEGNRFRLTDAQLSAGAQQIPIWVGARGERLLELAGEQADGVVLMVKSDLGDAMDVVEQGRAAGDVRPLTRVYLDRLAYTAAMIEEAKGLYSYALMDSPDRMLGNLGLDPAEIEALRAALLHGGPAAVAPLVTDTMLGNFQIAGTPDQCRATLGNLVAAHQLDVFMMNVTTSGLDANVALLTEIRSIVRDSSPS
ncbi:MAG TPA: LLM class flavin-dependent oxidoreductase [Ilumatobacteraceae bacterium]|nr:LLM class flavin-dependent oxidoreductase [Ilumatobacteraceae bacterium]HRB01818.1 LLM class flavin-dependent oxidoreductase [Ilumatobacteraceae bacterium]